MKVEQGKLYKTVVPEKTLFKKLSFTAKRLLNKVFNLR